jgi:hypothetical protein
MQNRLLRKQLAQTSTFCTFLGIFVMGFKRLLDGLGIIDLAPWGFYIGLVCFAIALVAFLLVIYLDEIHVMKTPKESSRQID